MIDRDRALIERVAKPYSALHYMLVNYPEELAALLSAARDEGRAEGLGGWEPIETAPRDGTFVLLALRGGDFPIVGSCDTKGGEFGCARYGDAFWPQPTHWRPFPNPPPGVEKANG